MEDDVSDLLTLTSGESNELTTLLSSGKAQEAKQLVVAVASLINYSPVLVSDFFIVIIFFSVLMTRSVLCILTIDFNRRRRLFMSKLNSYVGSMFFFTLLNLHSLDRSFKGVTPTNDNGTKYPTIDRWQYNKRLDQSNYDIVTRRHVYRTRKYY